MKRAFWAVVIIGMAAGTLPLGTALAEEAQASKFEQDRAAILALTGEYKVKFQFQETVAIEPGYELKEPYTSGATEYVEVVEDTGTYIALQHVLVMHPEGAEEPIVVKHWRQDWTYQDTELTRFKGNRQWQKETITAEEAAGKWSQAVFQVDDSPRYEGIAEWVHIGNRSVWESDLTWRPLPRREFSKRSDYQVLGATNRHTITPAGWVHEQDNFKLVLDENGEPLKVLAHETGLNVYDRVDDVDFAAGREYWKDTEKYWSDVRELWTEVLSEDGLVAFKGKVDDKPMWQHFFKIASEIRETGEYDREAVLPRIREIVEMFRVS
ncbi:MAG: DUF6607 family protein [Planctomycetota bacterium]